MFALLGYIWWHLHPPSFYVGAGISAFALLVAVGLPAREASSLPVDAEEDRPMVFDLVSNREVDWTQVPRKPNGVAANGQVAHVRYLYQGSREDPYAITFFRSGDRCWATCTCPAGKKRKVCKHRTSLLQNSPEIRDFISNSELGEAWEKYAGTIDERGEPASQEYTYARWNLAEQIKAPRGFAQYMQP